MNYKILLKDLKNILSRFHLANEGEAYERTYWFLFKERFPNYEIFWRYFAVPATNRIISSITDPNQRIRHRETVADQITVITSLQYSMLLNLIYAYDHLQNFRLSSFEDFYFHLGSACDLAEDFCWRSHLLILESRGKQSEILQHLKKEDFLKLAENWYDEHYVGAYNNYLTKGKPAPIKLPSKHNILDEYFQGSERWKEYKVYAQRLREYRNVIVHNISLGKLITVGGFTLVPKKEKVQQYKSWSKVFSVAGDALILKRDFIEMKEQMVLDIGHLQIMFNDLWSKTINEMEDLFFTERNHILLRKYDIEFV